MPESSHPLASGSIDHEDWQTVLIPEKSLTCGRSTTVSVAELTVLGNMQMNGTLNPTIQIWRQSNKDNNQKEYSLRGRMIDLRLNSNKCKLIQENQMPTHTRSAAEIFQCTITVNFDKDLTIQRRDILGIKLPPKPYTTFEILFNFNNSNPSNYVFPGNYSRPHTLNQMNSTEILDVEPQLKMLINNPGEYSNSIN